jgi:phage shock protein C
MENSWQNKLRRRPQQGMLAGVAAGMGEYFGVDPTAVRLAFVVFGLLGGFGVPLYLAAWLLVPAEGEAQSIAEEVSRQWA